eukprot:CAMPEP_0119132766 /NCGR_PEP_ID=MMETSP1310-20130426/12273_1 /TAXON_ID=464262 /ORGANISM="Genus nov. species nov., Strain RCC2339" /LENGTH=123 /DNA_ID=CAMNT_0007123419 /DNA_START=72 /DNA_END=443 /DNA_ORIENTATION=+
MGKVKAIELRGKKKAELESQLLELQKELAQLRVGKVTGNNPGKLAQIKVIRKSIARVKTVMTQTQRAQLRVALKNKKYLPLDLRSKKTRAIRRRLSDEERNAKTQRQAKRLAHFPQRKYAVKV